MKRLLLALKCLLIAQTVNVCAKDWVEYEAAKGPGNGKHVVLIAGDEEYRSEESMPMLGKILAKHHGFRCTALFSVAKDGTIDPKNQASLSHPEALESADLIVMLIRFRNWPDEAMVKFQAAMDRGVPIVALRTSTHAFRFPNKSPMVPYNLFGKEVLGEKWISHWGKHKVEATRGIFEGGNKDHPILTGVADVFGDSDVYEAAPPADATILVRGQVLKGMKPDDEPADYKKTPRGGVEQGINDPMMPVAWTRELDGKDGKKQRIFTTTMGAATDLQSEGLRRMIVNGVYWGLGLEVQAKAEVGIVGNFQALMYGFGTHRKGVKPEEHSMK